MCSAELGRSFGLRDSVGYTWKNAEKALFLDFIVVSH